MKRENIFLLFVHVSRHGERDKCLADGYSYTLWCNICKLPVSLLDIDLFTIFSQTNFSPFSIIATPRRSPNSDSFYFLTLFSFFLAASPARCLFARSSAQKGSQVMFRRSPLDAPNDVLLMMINISGIFSTTDREELFPEKHFLIKIIYHCLNCRENVVTAADTRATSKKK